MRDSGKDIQKYDVAYFMVSADKPEDNKRFAEQHEANFPILSDPSKKMPKAYGVLSSRGYCNRWTFYMDKEGVITKIDKKVKAFSAGAGTVGILADILGPK